MSWRRVPFCGMPSFMDAPPMDRGGTLFLILDILLNKENFLNFKDRIDLCSFSNEHTNYFSCHNCIHKEVPGIASTYFKGSLP